jgi:hypothetical protein
MVCREKKIVFVWLDDQQDSLKWGAAENGLFKRTFNVQTYYESKFDGSKWIHVET